MMCCVQGVHGIHSHHGREGDLGYFISCPPTEDQGRQLRIFKPAADTRVTPLVQLLHPGPAQRPRWRPPDDFRGEKLTVVQETLGGPISFPKGPILAQIPIPCDSLVKTFALMCHWFSKPIRDHFATE